MATHNKPTDPGPGPRWYYMPTDPDLDGSPALPYLQLFIDSVASQAIDSGSVFDLVQTRLSQHLTQFDSVLSTLHAVFQLRDTTPAKASSEILAATPVDTAGGQAPPSPTLIERRRRTRPLKMKPTRTRDHIPPPIAEDRRAAEQNVVGTWLDHIPELPDDIVRQFALRDHDAAHDTELHDTRAEDNNDKHKTSAQQDDAGSVNIPSVGDPAANAVLGKITNSPYCNDPK
jgi:hypothetical protein